MRILALLLFTVTITMIAPSPANADCGGPMISVSRGDVDRGALLRVVGKGWGDECYDTGVPRDAHGVLGNPLTDIEIAFVQDGKATVVARGSADGEYRFEASVTVPSTLRPGAARLVAHSGGTGAYQRPTVIVSAAKPVGPEQSAVQTFGEPREPIHGPGVGTTEDADTRTWVIGGAAAVVLVAAAVLILRRRSAARD